MDTRNVVALVGRLAADPELKYTPDGDPVANFALAVNRSTRNPDGSFKDSLDGFFDCELWGGQAETLAERFRKGAELQIHGSLLQKKWKVKNGNQERTASKIEIRVRSIAEVIQAPKRKAEDQPPQEAEAAQGTGAETELQPA